MSMLGGNLPTVTVGEFSQIVIQQFEEGNYRPLFGLGKGGIGKSESIKELAKSHNIGYIDIRLLLYNEVDLKGIPYPDSNHIMTVWLQNDILPREDRDGKFGILVFDEITSAPASVRTASYQILNERRLGQYELPDGWLIVCLGNGIDDGGDFQGMEGNFANRCSVYNVVCSFEDWEAWGLRHNINKMVLDYLRWKPQDLHTYNPENPDEILFASPRSWMAVSDILNKNTGSMDEAGSVIGDNLENNKLLQRRILANIGCNVGRVFIAFCTKYPKAGNPYQILNGETVKIDENNRELLFITIQELVKLLHKEIKQELEVSSTGDISNEMLGRCRNGINWILSLTNEENKVAGIKDFTNYSLLPLEKCTQILMKLVIADKAAIQSGSLRIADSKLVKFMMDNNSIFTNNVQ